MVLGREACFNLPGATGFTCQKASYIWQISLSCSIVLQGLEDEMDTLNH